MIYESGYWKADLLKRADKLYRRTQQRRWSETSLARFEQEVMLGFYAVRKLQEARKISGRLWNRPVPLIQFRSSGKAVRHLNWDRIDVLYKLDTPDCVQRPLSFVTNQVIHSYVFVPGFDESNRLVNLFFASDREKDRLLSAVTVSEIAQIFEEVGNNDPVSSRMSWDPATGRENIEVD